MLMHLRIDLCLLALALPACFPTPPLVFNETAGVLPPGRVALSFGGAVAAVVPSGVGSPMGGAGVRVRAGIGDRQEAGVDLMVGGMVDSVVAGGRVAWKRGLLAPLALLAGADIGYSHTSGVSMGDNQVSGGGDVGLVASPARELTVRPYGGVRAGLGGYFDAGGGSGQPCCGWFIPQAAFGLSIESDGPFRMSIEGGYAGLLTFAAHDASYSHQLYGSLCLTFLLGREKRR